VELLPETREALNEFVDLDEVEPEGLLDKLGKAVSRVVPEVIGLSLGLVKDQLTFTLVASTDEIAVLDASQYLDGGPCVEVSQGHADVLAFPDDDPLDEKRWRLFSEATAARGVASTLSLPLHEGEHLIGGVNMYASTAEAFAGRIDQLAMIVGAAPITAVSNADLSFSTRLEAAATPQRMRDRAIIETAVGWVASERGIDVEAANQQLAQAAARAGIRLVEVARVLLSIYTERED
jgi:transcriptional regulator with GAF, ATPase, and Fis domain